MYKSEFIYLSSRGLVLFSAAKLFQPSLMYVGKVYVVSLKGLPSSRLPPKPDSARIS
jgi:hypothetical protein